MRLRTLLAALAAFPLALPGCETADVPGTSAIEVAPPPVCHTMAGCKLREAAIVREAVERVPDSLKFVTIDGVRTSERILWTKPPGLTDAELTLLRDIYAQMARIQCPDGCPPIPMLVYRRVDSATMAKLTANMYAELRECAKGNKSARCPDIPLSDPWWEAMDAALRECASGNKGNNKWPCPDLPLSDPWWERMGLREKQ